ncbi:hypothetical protein LB572_00965 [Mesorhizobium sp. BH1-1-5]|uniref:hypothetical protein n=1 Tax=Mesorhizobium sp. BH1-1-5 TaxID=2876661 RepID=UPI001CCCA968|nr:hypothetical protein [Mesorhizobium sp. BH1-1-5]MBZ9985659.1 hypothetical protein [Mesorhizobium sp. BH1-1-5]
MATRGFLGLKSGFPVLKIMADAADDPEATSNTDWEKFRFNSETTEYSYIDDIIEWPMGTTTYYPPGSNSSNYVLKNEVISGYDWVFCHAARAIAYYGFLPLILHRSYDPATGKIYYFRLTSAGLNGNPLAMGKVKNITSSAWLSAFFNSSGTGHPDEMLCGYPLTDFGYANMSVVTRFPCDRDYTALTGVPVPGDCFAVFDEKTGKARVARGGFDARTASRTQCMIHEDQRPIGVVTQGFASSIAAGATVTIPTGVDVPDGAFPFLIGANSSGNMASLSTPTASFVTPGMAFEAEIVGNDVKITNRNNQAVSCFYLVLVESKDPPTSGGGGKILYTEDGEIKIMRPGADVSAPVPADILLWSQYKYCPVVAYGKIAGTSFAGTPGSLTLRTYDLTIPALDNPPIILTAIQKVGASANMNDGDILIDGRWTAGFTGAPLWLSYYWEYDASADKVKFTVYDEDNGNWVLRYYVLAVPN